MFAGFEEFEALAVDFFQAIPGKLREGMIYPDHRSVFIRNGDRVGGIMQGLA